MECHSCITSQSSVTNDTIALNRSTQHGSRPGLRSLRRAVAVTRHNANRNICSRSVAYAGRRSHTRTYADAHPNYGADSQTCDRGPTGSDEHPNPHTSSQPDRHANAYPTCHTHTFPNSNCRTRCDYGSNKYAYSYTHACARAAPVTPELQPDFEVKVSEATLQFPESISFHLEISGQRSIENIDVEFGTNHVFSCASTSYWTARTDIDPGEEVSVTWDWDMRRRGSMPPGAAIWWRWRVTDDEGREFLTPRQETAFADERFDWQSHTDGNVTFHWYNGGDDFGRRIADGVRSGLETLELGKELVEPISVFVYESSQDVQGAVLFAQTWTGGLAYVQHNIILITVNPAEFERDLPGVVHELAHLLVEEVTFNCFGGLPTWLDEGLAVYAEGGLPDLQQIAIEEAIANDDLISLRSLNSSFPAGHSGAILSYALSYSLVDYLLDTHGWPKMQELLAVFSLGSTDEKAILQVYGCGLR